MKVREYKRLTMKGYRIPEDKEEVHPNFRLLYNRLAELEDKIENGTLIELPCKVGDTVYEIYKNCSKCSHFKEAGWEYDNHVKNLEKIIDRQSKDLNSQADRIIDLKAELENKDFYKELYEETKMREQKLNEFNGNLIIENQTLKDKLELKGKETAEKFLKKVNEFFRPFDKKSPIFLDLLLTKIENIAKQFGVEIKE